MRRRQRETSGAAGTIGLLLLAAGLGAPGCSLNTSGVGDDDARVDTGDADVPPEDVVPDGEDDGPFDGPQCRRDAECGDLSCEDGWLRCVENRCTPMAPGECPQDDVPCTQNRCPGGPNACLTQVDSNRCSPGYSCDPDLGCVTDTRCTSDAACDDGIVCTIDRCAPDGEHCIHDPPDADGDTVGANLECDADGRNCQCRGGDCDDGDPTVSPNLPELCANGRDDDCDDGVDYADRDSSCTALPPHDSCATAVPLVVADGITEIPDDSTGVASRALTSWCVPGAAFDGPAVYYSLELTAQSQVVIDTIDCGFDTVISLFQGCDGAELICNDDRKPDPTAGSRFEHRRLEPGSYIVRVAGRVPDQAGPFTLHYTVRPAGGEASCDDPIEATDGGMFVGWLSDPGELLEHADRGSCVDAGTGTGDQERFVIRPAVPTDLLVDSAGTEFEHSIYLRGGDCTAFLADDACVEGSAGTGNQLFWPGWAGPAYVTVDWIPPAFVGGNPDRPYHLLILL